MNIIKVFQITSLTVFLSISIVGCSSDVELNEALQAAEAPVLVVSPELNKQEIDAINEKIQSIITSNLRLKTSLEERIKNIEINVAEVTKGVEKNTSAYEGLKTTVDDLIGKVTNYFKPKKVAVIKKTAKKRTRVVKAAKPKYKVIGIDQWGAYKYVQLMDAQGNLRLLRRTESVDGWEVNSITDKKVVLVNAKGATLVLIPQA